MSETLTATRVPTDNPGSVDDDAEFAVIEHPLPF